MTERQPRSTRSGYRHFLPIQTRWSDNDVYGHANNVVYYEWFDTAVNRWLIERGLLSLADSPVVSLVVETSCTYFESVGFPDVLEVGIAVRQLGTSSIHYLIGIFREGEERAVAEGRYIHVTVCRTTRKATPIPDHMRQGLSELEL